MDENVAELAVKQVLPGLVGGLAANAHDDRGQEVLGNVLKHHNTGVARSVDEVDTEDGEKIVRNVFGDNTDKVVDKLANKASSSGSDITGEIIQQVLPIVAPIVLSWLANQFLGGGSGSARPRSRRSRPVPGRRHRRPARRAALQPTGPGDRG
ncbi:MAG: DUF937 domain-containing protein [Schumannella sp.]